MKNKILTLMALAAVLLTGCSQRDDIATTDVAVTENEGNVVFRLQSNTTTATRAGNAEDSREHVQGTADEYKVNNARVYLFDNVTKLFVKSVPLTNITRTGTDAEGDVVYDTDPISVAQGVYDIFVTANTYRTINTETEERFLADIDSLTYERALISDISGGIVMTNRAADNMATTITKGENDADISVVNVRLERVLARLDVAKSQETFPLTDAMGREYCRVTLDGFYIVNLPKYYYSFRHTAKLTSIEQPQWTMPTNFGNVDAVDGYVIDPYFFRKTIDASTFTNADKYYDQYYGDYVSPDVVRWTAFNAVAQTPNYKTAYCLENCMLAPAQKNGYSTGIVFRAVIEPSNNVYYLNNTGSLELLTDVQSYPDVLYYYNTRFYNSPEAAAAAIKASGAESGTVEARKYEKTSAGYRTYYKYWIRHLDNNKPNVMGVMEFAIVRNNLYRMLITNVSDPGEGTIVPNPDTPDEGETKLKVELNVKPWIVRDLTNIIL